MGGEGGPLHLLLPSLLKGKKQDGSRCTIAVDGRHPFCTFHSVGAYKEEMSRVLVKRADLVNTRGDGGPGRACGPAAPPHPAPPLRLPVLVLMPRTHAGHVVHGMRDRTGQLMPAKAGELGRNISAGAYSAAASASIAASAASAAAMGDDGEVLPPAGSKVAAVNRPTAAPIISHVTYDRSKYAALLAARPGGAARGHHQSLSVDAEGEVHAPPPPRKRPREEASATRTKGSEAVAGKGGEAAAAKDAARSEAAANRIRTAVENAGRPRGSLGSRAL